MRISQLTIHRFLGITSLQIDKTGEIGRDELLRQCELYMELFGIDDADLIDCSYSDMLAAAGEV